MDAWDSIEGILRRDKERQERDAWKQHGNPNPPHPEDEGAFDWVI